MSNPPAPSTNEPSKSIGNGPTVDVVSSIFRFFGLDAALTRRNANIALRKGLGEWAEEAFDEYNHCRQPLLREDPFVTHLIEKQASFCPSGSCKATFAWAKLLYALDIRPGSNIIEWQPVGTEPEKSGTVELELEGPVLCHIVNLYQIYDHPHSDPLQNFPSTLSQGVMWQFPFGVLAINPEPNGSQGSNPRWWIATFRPFPDEALSAPRQPFLARGQPLPFEGNSIAIKYVSTAKNSTYSDGVLELPHPMDTIRTRCLSLCKCLDTLMPEIDLSISNRRESCEEDAQRKPYLVTPTWIEQANRIKRRVTTKGGVYDGLAKLMVEILSQKPDVVEEIIDTMRITKCSDEDWEEAVRREVRRLSFYKDDTFMFDWDYPDHSYDSFSVRDIVVRELPNALKSLSQGSPKTWAGPFDEMVPEVMKILLHRKIINPLVLVIGLTSEHPLWKSTFYVQ
ncbi:hypothetical protein F4860DRAFT_177377 [Xylaria cubensis]|nr:hypothetical protein F4860DRAFT_177377 [Xylaria cubensis]